MTDCQIHLVRESGDVYEFQCRTHGTIFIERARYRGAPLTPPTMCWAGRMEARIVKLNKELCELRHVLHQQNIRTSEDPE